MFHVVEKGWDTNSYLLAHVIDGIRINNWQRTEGARRKPVRNVPDPYPRPGDNADDDTRGVGDTVSIGFGAATVVTVEEFQARRAEREQRWRDKRKRKRGD